ncbi:bacterial Ig-like domain-containing protein [Bifidobacterium leontopitheci]|nr:bacterial Ig-like domain-containing protein [Bifidobacterium leontopitheci]
MRRSVAVFAAAATLLTGGVVGTAAHAATGGGNVSTVTINPWVTNGPFEGWGTSLAWFANATGAYGDQQNYTADGKPADSALNAKANKNGAKLRQDFYDSIFGSNGLNLNKARYNVGGGNASDVAYGYPFMRQGAAVPGYWAPDADGSKGLYKDADGNAVTTKQADRDKLDAAYDPTNDESYVWGSKSKDSEAAKKVEAQEWWIKEGVKTGDITHWEAFANSAPYFMTESGYVAGGRNSSTDNNLKDPEKFGTYMGKVARHLEDKYGVNFNTVEPFNESESGSWITPWYNATDYTKDPSWPDAQLINRYMATGDYDGADLSITPYSNAVKKPQEGMHVSTSDANGGRMQQRTIETLSKALAGDKDTVISSTDAQFRDQFMEAYNNYTPAERAKIGQYNVHGYGGDATYNERNVRDVAQRDGKRLSMSEVDGSWQSGGFNPFGFDNALGFTSMINGYVYKLQSEDFNFWQVVEDLYNMEKGDKDENGNTLNPGGENTNWGTIFIDFDCNVTDAQGNLYSKRRVDNNGGKTDGLKPCSVLVNSKYNSMRAYTQFIGEGDSITANSATGTNFSAQSKDGKTQTVVHTNSSNEPQTFVIDLSNFKDIAADASGDLYLTTASDKADSDKGPFAATPETMNKTSDVKQAAGSVTIDAKAKTATMTVPARSIASVQLHGVSGVADTAPSIKDGGSATLVNQWAGKAVSVADSGDGLTLQEVAADKTAAAKQNLTFHEIAADPERPTLKRYVITTADGRLLSAADTDANGSVDAKSVGVKLVSGDVEQAKKNQSTIWILNTEDGVHFNFVNAAAAKTLTANSSDAGSALTLELSKGQTGQGWSVRSNTPTGVRDVRVQVPVGATADAVRAALGTTVTPYYTWGTGAPIAIDGQWDVSGVDTAAKGAYTASAKATDLYGNEIAVKATVHVGDLTTADPASVTVKTGSDEASVKAAAPATVNAHVGTSEAIAAPVEWQWPSDLASRLAAAKSGDALQVDGTLKAYPAIHVRLTVYVEDEQTRNVASDTFGPTYTDADTTDTSKTINGDTTDKGWTTWKADGQAKAETPTATFGYSADQTVSEIRVYYYKDAGSATWPASVSVNYWNGKAYVPFGDAVSLPDTADKAPVAVIKVAKPITGNWFNIVNTVGAAHPYISVSEIELISPTGKLLPTTDTALGELRADGVRLDGFDPDKLPEDGVFQGKLAADAETYPTITAYAADNAANVNVEQPSVKNGGKATITVTPADGGAARTYTVDYGELPKLTLRVTAPKKTTYEIGDKLDLTGLKVEAVWTKDGKETVKDVALDDPQLAVSGFDSASAGVKTVTVAWRGASATFQVTVKKAAEQQPGGKPQPKPQPGTKPGAGKPGAGNGAGSGAGARPVASGKGSGLSRTGASVTGVIGVVALLVAAAGVVLITRKRRG